MTRTEALADIRARFPAIPKSVAERHWRKSDAFLRMLASKYAAHTNGGTLTQFVRDVAKGGAGIARAGARANEDEDEDKTKGRTE